MAKATKSYNPGFLTDDELRAMFCVRAGEFESLRETLRENTGESNQHAIVIGPRGSGKTTLLLRVALEVRSDPGLSSRLYPIVFAEESYSVSTCGEFWLECLSRLAEQEPSRAGTPDLRRTVEEVRRERDDRVLRERCLGVLLDFAEREGKRLVLQVENLNMLFSDMMDPDAGWCLRKTLQTEPRIMMIGSATSRFGEIDRPDRALYDLFRVLTLQPLDREESAVLCESVSGKPLDDGVVRRLQILTGGSPRLLAIVARFGVARSFRTLMSNLLDLVDAYTAYFKSHLESLPAQERRVYLALAELWKPATAREIGERARMETSKCSAQLRRLVGRGVVSDEGGTHRRKEYYVTERLYNIYYLLRRSRGVDSLVGALVRFMDAYYSRSELEGIVDEMVGELGGVDPGMRVIYRTALQRFSSLPELAWHFYREYPDHVPDDVKTVTETAAALLEQGARKFEDGDLRGALVDLEDLLDRFGSHTAPTVKEAVAIALYHKGDILGRLGRGEHAMLAFAEADELAEAMDSPQLRALMATALLKKSSILTELGRTRDALTAYYELQERFGSSDSVDVLAIVVGGLASWTATLCSLGRWDEALTVCEETWNRFGSHESSRVLLPALGALALGSEILGVQGRMREHLAGYEELLNRLDVFDRRAIPDEMAHFGMEAEFKEAVLRLRLTAHENRLPTHARNGNVTAATDDVRAILKTLPQLAAMPATSIQSLMAATCTLGPDRVASLIRESPSASHLLPLTTALDWEMGKEPRVALEVRRVAKDMRRELSEIRSPSLTTPPPAPAR